MISEKNTPSNKNPFLSINRQIYEKINSKAKLNIQPNSKTKSNNIFITPTKLQKYTQLYSKYKSFSKASTKQNTNKMNKSKSTFKPPFSLYYFTRIKSAQKYPLLISNFSNNNVLYPKTPNKKSRNIQQKFQKHSTMDKNGKLYPNIQSLNSLSTQSLMHNTMKNLTSYKKFFLNRKKINITATNKNKINKNDKNTNNKYNVKSNKVVRIKKYKLSINDEESFNNNKMKDKMIKTFLDLKLIQKKIINGLNKKNETIKKKPAYNNEFSFNRDFILDNYYIDNDGIKRCENNNDDIINFVNNDDRSNLIQSNIITNISEIERNKKIYEENYECDTPQFTTLDEQKLI